MKEILIVKVSKLEDNYNFIGSFGSYGINQKELYKAYLVIVKTRSHFRCIKNYWDPTCEDEKIPIDLLSPYLQRYAGYFTHEELMNCFL